MNYLLDKLDAKKRNELLGALSEAMKPKRDFFDSLTEKNESEFKDLAPIKKQERKNRRGKARKPEEEK
jgi:hypothetical protein